MSTVRPLMADDVPDFRVLRLESLKPYPETFAASYELEAVQDLSFFEKRLQIGTVLGGFQNGQLSACASFRRLEHKNLQHKSMLSGIYVRKEAQGTGLADDLLINLLTYGRGCVEIV